MYKKRSFLIILGLLFVGCGDLPARGAVDKGIAGAVSGACFLGAGYFYNEKNKALRDLEEFDAKFSDGSLDLDSLVKREDLESRYLKCKKRSALCAATGAVSGCYLLKDQLFAAAGLLGLGVFAQGSSAQGGITTPSHPLPSPPSLGHSDPSLGHSDSSLTPPDSPMGRLVEGLKACRENVLTNVRYTDDSSRGALVDEQAISRVVEQFQLAQRDILTSCGVEAAERYYGDFVQKVTVKPGERVVVFGDIHGGLLPLHENLDDLRELHLIDENNIIPEGVTFVFTGDYPDRGRYGCEVLFTVYSLALINPGKVFLVRGNHEEYQINMDYGLSNEIDRKFGQYSGLFDSLNRSFFYLPSAVYLGCGENFIQINHGGVPLASDGGLALDGLAEFLDDRRARILPINELTGTRLRWGDIKEGNFNSPSWRGVEGVFNIGEERIPAVYEGTPVKNIFVGHQHHAYSVGFPGAPEVRESDQGSLSRVRVTGIRHEERVHVSDHNAYIFMSAIEAYQRRLQCTVRRGFGVLNTAEDYDDWTLTAYAWPME